MEFFSPDSSGILLRNAVQKKIERIAGMAPEQKKRLLRSAPYYETNSNKNLIEIETESEGNIVLIDRIVLEHRV